MSVFLQDPDSVLDYTFDWSDWLTGGDTIATATVTASTGLTVDSTTVGSTGVTAWISTPGATGKRNLACLITTVGGRTAERTAQINVEER